MNRAGILAIQKQDGRLSVKLVAAALKKLQKKCLERFVKKCLERFAISRKVLYDINCQTIAKCMIEKSYCVLIYVGEA